jgi:hypothetical protein
MPETKPTATGGGEETPSLLHSAAPQTVQRYLVEKTGLPYVMWRFNNKTSQKPTPGTGFAVV